MVVLLLFFHPIKVNDPLPWRKKGYEFLYRGGGGGGEGEEEGHTRKKKDVDNELYYWPREKKRGGKKGGTKPHPDGKK